MSKEVQIVKSVKDMSLEELETLQKEIEQEKTLKLKPTIAAVIEPDDIEAQLRKNNDLYIAYNDYISEASDFWDETFQGFSFTATVSLTTIIDVEAPLIEDNFSSISFVDFCSDMDIKLYSSTYDDIFTQLIDKSDEAKELRKKLKEFKADYNKKLSALAKKHKVKISALQEHFWDELVLNVC